MVEPDEQEALVVMKYVHMVTLTLYAIVLLRLVLAPWMTFSILVGSPFGFRASWRNRIFHARAAPGWIGKSCTQPSRRRSGLMVFIVALQRGSLAS